MKQLLALLTFSASLTGCAISPAAIQCRNWQQSGLVFSTLDSCVKCVNQLGTNSPDTIQGCAIGLDAGSIIDLVQ